MVSRACRVGEIDGAPFDVKYPIGRSAGYRDEDTARSAWITRAARIGVGALIIPIRQDRVVVSRPRQTDIREVRVGSRELSVTVGR